MTLGALRAPGAFPYSSDMAEFADRGPGAGEPRSAKAPAPPPFSIGLVLGIVAFVAILAAGPLPGLGLAGSRTLALATLMAIWWASEAVPIAVTALLPIVLLPLLGVAKVDAVAESYANPVLFLFLGGFLLGAGIERWGLDKRMAYAVARRSAGHPARLIAGIMLVTAFISMWVNNTTTTMMVLPIALSVLGIVRRELGEATRSGRNTAIALVLCVPYAASIGGVGTIVGTAPNALLTGFLAENYGIEISFARWLMFGLPFVAVMLLAAWVLLTQIVYPIGKPAPGFGERVRAHLDAESAARGTLTQAELRVAIIFASMVVLWVTRPLLAALPGLGALSDAAIAMAGGIALFLVPAGPDQGGRKLLSWDDTRRVPWEVLILFGGGLALAQAFMDTGLSAWTASGIGGLGDWPPFFFVLTLTLLMIFLGEFTSNTAMTAAFLPIVGALAVGLDMNPLLLAVPMTLAANSSFMLPVGTPPNALAFGTGHVRTPEMIRVGIWLDLVCVFVIAVLAVTLVPLAVGSVQP